MTHVSLKVSAPGIVGLLESFPDSGKVLRELAEFLLRGPHALSVGEREFIAAYVSFRNGCRFCWMSHGAAAAVHLAIDEGELRARLEDPTRGGTKTDALCRVADAARSKVERVPPQLVTAARASGAGDAEIHHAVLIAAAFSMYNRYVEGLGTESPAAFSEYVSMGQRLATQGYAMRSPRG